MDGKEMTLGELEAAYKQQVRIGWETQDRARAAQRGHLPGCSSTADYLSSAASDHMRAASAIAEIIYRHPEYDFDEWNQTGRWRCEDPVTA